jgi:hypothetical protein
MNQGSGADRVHPQVLRPAPVSRYRLHQGLPPPNWFHLGMRLPHLKQISSGKAQSGSSGEFRLRPQRTSFGGSDLLLKGLDLLKHLYASQPGCGI